MSKFIQEQGNLDKDGKYLKITYPENLKKDEYYNILLFEKPEKNHNKELNDALLSLTSEVLGNLSVNKKDFGSKISDQNINIDKVFLLKDIGKFLGYLNNCQSYKNDGEIESFDKIELLKRLKSIENNLLR